MYRNTQSGALQDSDKNKFPWGVGINHREMRESSLGHSMCQEVRLLLRQVGESQLKVDMLTINWEEFVIQILLYKHLRPLMFRWK
jgi:hypothetical protein